MAMAVAQAQAVSMRGVRGVGLMVLLLLASRTARAEPARALERDGEMPTTGTQWFVRGHSLYVERRYRESVAAFERALQLHVANAPEGAWNVARGYARLGNRKQTLRWLSHARDMGFRDAGAMHGDPAFDQFRGDPGFREVIAPARHESARQRGRVTIML